ncbi:DUF302 domain-containing protein [Gammaproteobacteria bacterium]
MYGFDIAVSGSLDEALLRVREALAREGFGVLFDIDVQSIFKTKLGVDSRPYRILGACNPGYAHRALGVDPDIGLLLPCNVIVREEEDGRFTVAFMDPNALLTLVGRPGIAPIAEQVRTSLMKARNSLDA